MAEDIDNKPLTVKDVREVLIPAMEGVFATKKDLENFATKKDLGILMAEMATKKDLAALQGEMAEKFDILFGFSDKIMKDLDILMTEKEMGYYQKQKERKLWAIMIDALQKHNILSAEQVKQISELEVF